MPTQVWDLGLLDLAAGAVTGNAAQSGQDAGFLSQALEGSSVVTYLRRPQGPCFLSATPTQQDLQRGEPSDLLGLASEWGVLF